MVNFSTVDKLFSVFDDGSNPMYSNPPKGKSLTLKNFPQVAQYAGLGYNHGMKGPIIITEGTLKNGTLQKEDSGLGLDIMFSAHRNSYFREKTWGKYDVLGFKGGKATMTLKLKTQKFYASQYMFIDELIGNIS